MRGWFFRVFAAFFACGPALASGREVIVDSKSGDPLFRFVIFDSGETFWNPNVPNPGGQAADSTWTLADVHLTAIRSGADYWAELLGGLPANSSPVVINVGTESVENAYGLTLSNPGTGYTYPTDWILNDNAVNPSGQMVIGYGYDGSPTYNGAVGVLPSGAAWNQKYLSGTVAHELGHLMGITSYSAHVDGASFGYGSINLTVALGGGNYDAHLYDSFGRPMTGFQGFTLLEMLQRELGNNLLGTIAYGVMQLSMPAEFALLNGRPIYDVVSGNSPAAGKFTLRPDDGDANYDEGEYAYFKGAKVSEVLRGADVSRGGNITDAIPINTWEGGHPEMSHIELRNSMMSHQWYRNFETFMEAELALLEDIGVMLDRGAFYGYSVYGDNTSETITRGLDSAARWAVGLHVYGTNNTLTVNGDVNSTGDRSVGARIDGWENSLTFNNSINMTGQGSAGILVAYGKGHDIVVKGVVSAETGLQFDFGGNSLGNSTEYRGSYIRTRGGTSLATASNLALLPELKGALVDNVEIIGAKITGAGGTAIKIAENAFVRNILISDGGEIHGDILSEWNPFLSQVQYSGGKGDLITEIGFRDAKLFGSIYALGANVNVPGELDWGGGTIRANNMDVSGTVASGVFSQIDIAHDFDISGEMSISGNITADNFVLTGEMTFDPALGKTTIAASNADFAAGSAVHLRIAGDAFGYGEYNGAEFSVLDVNASSFINDADYDFAPSGEFDRGFYHYRYSDPTWRVAGGVNSLYVSSDGKKLVPERTGIAAAKLPIALAAHSAVPDMLADRIKRRMNDNLQLNPTGAHASAGLQFSDKLSSRSAAFGADFGKRGFFVAGLQAGLEDMGTSSELAELDSSGLGLDAYAGFYLVGGFRAHASVGVETLSYSHARVVDGNMYEAKYRGRTARMVASVSRPVSFNYGRFVATPVASVVETMLSVGGIGEIGAAGNKYALGFAPQKYRLGGLTAGIDFAYNPRGGFSYDFGAHYRKWSVDAAAARTWFAADQDKNAIEISEESAGMNALIFGFGVSSDLTRGAKLSGRYKIIAGEWATIHNLSVNLSARF
ncbi:MAG: hypothetical protein LBL21_01755 [Rickettsiales bacterium]|jgi:hypothetical protein|nr:hypothetical protein [Rickettsiales bacterium]